MMYAKKLKPALALIAVFLGTAASVQAIYIPPIIFFSTVVEVDFSAPGSTVYTEHIPTDTGPQNELHFVATVVLKAGVAGQTTPLSITQPRSNYHVKISGAVNPTAANLGHLKSCQQSALLAASNPAKFKLVLSHVSSTYKDVNDTTLATEIGLGADAVSGAGYTNVRCSLIRR